MLLNSVIKIDTSTSMNHKISTSTLCLLLLLALDMINNILNISANINAHTCIITPSTTIINEISMVNAILPSMITNIGTNRCKTVVTTIAIPVVVTFYDNCINTINILITSTKAGITTITNNFL